MPACSSGIREERLPEPHQVRADGEWQTIHAFTRTSRGRPRSRRYAVRARPYEVDGERSLFVFGPAAQTPFGLLSDNQKYEVGAIALECYQSGR